LSSLIKTSESSEQVRQESYSRIHTAAAQYDTAGYEHHKTTAFALIAEVKAERQELADLTHGQR
jgi:hypothetical protein